MATKLNSPTLFSKLASIMRGPSGRKTHDVDAEASGIGDLDQEKLRARIDSKRHDDAIRKREFSYLRKLLIKRNAAAHGFVASSLFAGSSGFDRTDRRRNNRAATVKKIDAIEASMAEQWTKRKPLLSDPHLKKQISPDALFNRPESASNAAVAPAPSPAPAVPPRSSGLSTNAVAADDFDLDFTGLTTDPVPLAEEQALVRAVNAENPAVQSAAMRFAEGDYPSAESTLQDAIDNPSSADDVVEQCALALVDMYRSLGDAAKFDRVAIEYATRFGRSPPEWYSVPAHLALTTSVTASDLSPRDNSLWACPPVLDGAAVARLAAAQSDRDFRLVHWGQLQSITDDAIRPLTRLLAQWAGKSGRLVFDGISTLTILLELATPNGDNTRAADRWMLRLEVLRLQGLVDDYEAVAMDYCITYEVSPPSWSAPVCHFTTSSPQPPVAAVQTVRHDVADSVPVGISGFGFMDKMVLQGELLGDAALGIEDLIDKALPGAPIVIDCRNLVRVDFAAAGRLLNWLAQHEAETVLVQFVNVPRLVLAFFQEMGISEFAEVSVSAK